LNSSLLFYLSPTPPPRGRGRKIKSNEVLSPFSPGRRGWGDEVNESGKSLPE